MICQTCGKKQATFHMTKIINGIKEEQHLCEECAKTLEGNNLLNDLSFSNKFSFQDMLSGLIEYMNVSTPKLTTNDIVCKSCGTSYRDFKSNGLLGCSECYNTFKETVDSVVRRVQPSLEHRGKIPNKNSQKILLEKEILRLKEALRNAIDLEEFEKAAELRDELRRLNS